LDRETLLSVYPHRKINPSRAAAMPQKTPPKHPAHRKMTNPPKITAPQKYDPNGLKTPSKRGNPPEITRPQFGNTTRYQNGAQQLRLSFVRSELSILHALPLSIRCDTS